MVRLSRRQMIVAEEEGGRKTEIKREGGGRNAEKKGRGRERDRERDRDRERERQRERGGESNVVFTTSLCNLQR